MTMIRIAAATLALLSPVLAHATPRIARNVGSVDNRYAAAVSPYGRRSVAAYRAGRGPHFPLGHVLTTSPALPRQRGFPFLIMGKA